MIARRRFRLAAVVAAAVAMLTAAASAQDAAVVANVKVVSDKVKDVSSLEAWRASYITEGMSDKAKALACWETVVAHQHQDSPPWEYLNHEGIVQDAIKMFNVYGYSFCGVAANELASLARYVGLKVRIHTIRAHVLPEVWWDGAWHMLDASLINYFPKADGDIASIQEIIDACKAWYEKNPDYWKDGKGLDAKLRKLHQSGGWTGWTKGPELLTRCPFYAPTGWLPAHTHGWYSTMQEYDGSTLFPYEAGYSMGYKVNIQLRPGERLTRNWSNKGLHVNMPGGGKPGCLKGKVGKGSLRYTPKYGDIAPGRVGNGTLEYDVPLAGPSLPTTALRYENLRADPAAKPVLQAADAAKQAILEIRMPCSYVYLTGRAELDAAVGTDGSVRVFLSDNNGLDWQEVATLDKPGPAKLDLSKLVLRRYDYRLRVLLKGKGSGLNALKLHHDIQHSQRPLPALARGRNTITFSAGPHQGTVTIEGSMDPAHKDRQLVCADFHPVINDLREKLLLVDMRRGKGDVTYTLDAPGDITRMNVLTHYRARSKRGGWQVQVSFDGGKSFKTVADCPGPTVFHGNYTVIRDVPPKTRSAKVRLLGTAGGNATCLFNQRIDADYKLPGGGFRPVKVTYLWEEGGIEKKHEHVASSPKETYTIKCGSTPTMKAIILELAGTN